MHNEINPVEAPLCSFVTPRILGAIVGLQSGFAPLMYREHAGSNKMKTIWRYL